MINSINLVIDLNHPSTDGKNVHISKVSEITNGSVDRITCTILDSLPIAQRNAYLIEMMQKVKNNGELILKFVNVSRLFKDYLSGKLNSNKISEIINPMNSISSSSDISEIVSEQKVFSIEKQYVDDYLLITVLRKKI